MKAIQISIILLLVGYASFAQNATLKVKTYVLDNGLTVYLNHDETASSVFGAVVVKAGSKDDPADATGIAHYLEHLLFKGTNELGTTNYEKEKPHLDSINMFYDLLGKTTDVEERKSLQEKINQQSVKASQYGLPNEFDNLIKGIGGTGVNAFTSDDMTVYHNSFPGVQLDKWLELYSHRFINPVFRSFQSELEVVYEEKNRSMDNFQRLLFEELNKNLYKGHPYGTQTTLGSVEHLKNPSLTKMYEFFNKYYIPNNMALVLCGNFNTIQAKQSIQNYFSKLEKGPAVLRSAPKPYVIPKNELKKVKYTPIKVSMIGYKTVPSNHKDQVALTVALSLLSNYSETGSLDKLSLDGKIMMAGAFDYSLNDDGSVIFFIVPKILGQSFDDAEKLVLKEIENLKSGNIPENLLKIVKTEMYIEHQESLENSQNRGYTIASLFSTNETWDEHLLYSERINSVTIEDVQRVVKTYFNKNSFTLRSGTGFPKKKTLEKPGFKPVVAKADAKSEYAETFEAKKINPTPPRYINPEKDVTRLKLNESNTLFHVNNPINKIFKLRISFRVGSDSIENLNYATELGSYFYTKRYSLDSLKTELGKLGMTYSLTSSANNMSVYLTGIDWNIDESLKLIKSVIYDPLVDNEKMKILVDDLKSTRKFNVKDPQTIGDALYKYAVLGEESSYLKQISLKDFKKLTSNELINQYKKALKYNAYWHYSGSTPPELLKRMIQMHFPLADNNLETPIKTSAWIKPSETTIYTSNNKKAVQSSVNFFINSDNMRYTLQSKSDFKAFNQYMGGGFSGIILQEIREYRSLAYSSYGYISGSYVDNRPATFRSYIGCQSDKTNEAINVMLSLLDTMPLKPERMDMIRSGLKNSAASNYPRFRYLSYYIEYAERFGSPYLFTEAEYKNYDSLSFSNITSVYKKYVANRPKIITVSGNMKKVDSEELEKLGKVIKVKRKDLFVK